jgi:hypothetical protein
MFGIPEVFKNKLDEVDTAKSDGVGEVSETENAAGSGQSLREVHQESVSKVVNEGEGKQRRKRRTRAEMEAARGQSSGEAGPKLGDVVDVEPLKKGAKILFKGIDGLFTKKMARRLQRLPNQLISEQEKKEILEDFPYEEQEIDQVVFELGELAKEYPIIAQFGTRILAVAALASGGIRKSTSLSQVKDIEERYKKSLDVSRPPQVDPARNLPPVPNYRGKVPLAELKRSMEENGHPSENIDGHSTQG